MVTAFTFPEQSNINEKKARNIALIITAAVATLLLLLLILIRIVTPIPALPPPTDVPVLEIGIEPGTGGDAAISGGGSNGNTGDPGMQNPTDAHNPTPTHPTDNGAVTDNNPDNPSAANSNHTSPTTTTPTVSNDVLAAIANFNKNKGKASIKLGGNGNGDPYTGGLGNGSGTGVGPENGGDPGNHGGGGDPNGQGSGVYRHILFKPEIVNPTQEEGKVVVIVHVDRNGNVISGKNEIGAATTTLNSVLRSTATQSAYHIKFDASPNGPVDQAIAIDIYFTLK